MQFGFMPGCETKNAIFILRHLQEKYLEKKEFVLLHLHVWRKLLRVSRDVAWWVSRKLGVEE